MPSGPGSHRLSGACCRLVERCTRLAAVSLGPRTQARAEEALPWRCCGALAPGRGPQWPAPGAEGRGGTVLELPLSGLSAAPSSSMFRRDVVVTLPARLESGSYRLKLGADRPFLR